MSSRKPAPQGRAPDLLSSDELRGPTVGELIADVRAARGAPYPYQRQLRYGDVPRYVTMTGEDTKTQQHLRDEVDVNTIVRRFGATGQLPVTDGARIADQYGDFTDVNDFESAFARIEAAVDSFLALPAAVREKYKNDPRRFIKRAQEIGLEDLDAEVRAAVTAPGVGGAPVDGSGAAAAPTTPAPAPGAGQAGSVPSGAG